jgi:hypothetical protein
MQVQRSKSGLHTIAEGGGGSSNTGFAEIVCGSGGEKMRAMFIPRGYSNGEHAIFKAEVGMCIVSASHSRSGETVKVERIVSISTDDLSLSLMGEWENGDGNIPATFDAAIQAAREKNHCYHCREAHYVA